MRINIEENYGKTRETVNLTTNLILRYLITEDDALDKIIILNPNNYKITTTNINLYEALGSIKPYDEFKLNKLTKLTENTFIKTIGKPEVLTEKRVDEIRKQALKQEG